MTKCEFLVPFTDITQEGMHFYHACEVLYVLFPARVGKLTLFWLSFVLLFGHSDKKSSRLWLVHVQWNVHCCSFIIKGFALTPRWRTVWKSTISRGRRGLNVSWVFWFRWTARGSQTQVWNVWSLLILLWGRPTQAGWAGTGGCMLNWDAQWCSWCYRSIGESRSGAGKCWFWSVFWSCWEDARDPHPRELQVILGGRTFSAPVSFDGVCNGDYREIATTLRISHSAIQDPGEDMCDKFTLKSWDGQLYWGFDVDCLTSRARPNAISIYGIDW